MDVPYLKLDNPQELHMITRSLHETSMLYRCFRTKIDAIQAEFDAKISAAKANLYNEIKNAQREREDRLNFIYARGRN